jgi:Phage integrase, N-terminal SAM-like domain
MRRSWVQFPLWAPESSWSGCISGLNLRDPTSGRASQLSRTVRGTKREGQRALAALVAEVSAAKVLSSSMTLGELLARWLDHVDEQLSPTTVREYRRLVTRMINPDLGKLTLRRLTTQRLDAGGDGASPGSATVSIGDSDDAGSSDVADVAADQPPPPTAVQQGAAGGDDNRGDN